MKYNYLNKEDEYKLITDYQNGNDAALTTLLAFNQLNIKIILQRFRYPHHYDYQDAVQEANIALIRAIKTFDTSTNNRLITYASKIIRNSLLKTIVIDGIIRLPYPAFKAINNIKQGIISSEYTDDTIRTASYNYRAYDIDEHYDNELFAITDNDLEQFQMKEMIQSVVSELDDDSRTIIEHRFTLNDKPFLSLVDIARIYFNASNQYDCIDRLDSVGRRKEIKALKELKRLMKVRYNIDNYYED